MGTRRFSVIAFVKHLAQMLVNRSRLAEPYPGGERQARFCVLISAQDNLPLVVDGDTLVRYKLIYLLFPQTVLPKEVWRGIKLGIESLLKIVTLDDSGIGLACVIVSRFASRTLDQLQRSKLVGFLLICYVATMLPGHILSQIAVSLSPLALLALHEDRRVSSTILGCPFLQFFVDNQELLAHALVLCGRQGGH